MRRILEVVKEPKGIDIVTYPCYNHNSSKPYWRKTNFFNNRHCTQFNPTLVQCVVGQYLFFCVGKETTYPL